MLSHFWWNKDECIGVGDGKINRGFRVFDSTRRSDGSCSLFWSVIFRNSNTPLHEHGLQLAQSPQRVSIIEHLREVEYDCKCTTALWMPFLVLDTDGYRRNAIFFDWRMHTQQQIYVIATNHRYQTTWPARACALTCIHSIHISPRTPMLFAHYNEICHR